MFHERVGYKVIQPTKHMDAYRSVPFSLFFFQPGKVTQSSSGHSLRHRFERACANREAGYVNHG